jgi:hypothetical protein
LGFFEYREEMMRRNLSFNNPRSNERSTTKKRVSTEINESKEVKTSADEVKRRWRGNQIILQMKNNRPVESSWRIRQTDSWCGWLLARKSFPQGKWERRWFEMRPAPLDNDMSCIVLHYYHVDKKAKQLETKALIVTSITRISDLDSIANCVFAITTMAQNDINYLGTQSSVIGNDFEKIVLRRLQRKSTQQAKQIFPQKADMSTHTDTTSTEISFVDASEDFGQNGRPRFQIERAGSWGGSMLEHGCSRFLSWRQSGRRAMEAAAALGRRLARRASLDSLVGF